jgi:LPXTG-motif cell wall-anchored protein
MSISIQSGPHISIANSQIVQPDATILSDGSINYNDTVNEVNVIGLLPPNAKDTVQLGRQFLSGAYLMVNEDHGTFTLWQVTGGSDKSLVAVDENNVVSTPTCSSTAVTSPLPTGSLSSSPSAHPSPPKSTTSSIVGPVVGAIAGVVLLVALGVFFWMRKRKNKAVRAADNSPYAHNVDEKAISLYNYGAPERNNSAHEPWGNPVNEVGGNVTPEEEKNKQSTAASGIHELEHSY